jgi:Homeodomain-like domain
MTATSDRQQQPTSTKKGSVRRGSVEIREHEARALALRKEGATYEQIGAEFGISDRMASRIVKRALTGLVRESAAELLALEGERLDMLLQAVMPKALQGSARHVEAALKISERRCRMFGLDAPARVDLEAEVLARVTVEQLDAEIERLLAEYSGDDRP